MAGNPADERFRPPDPSLGIGKSNVQSTNIEVMEGSSSSSSHLREEAIQVATVEADMDELRRHVEMSRNTSGKVEEIQRADEQLGLGGVESQALEAAGEERGVRNTESRHESEMVESQKNTQEQEIRDSHQQGNPSTQTHLRITNLNKDKETSQHYQQPAHANTRDPSLRETVHPLQNRQIAGNLTQGNLPLTNTIPNYAGNLQESERMNVDSVRNQNYQSDFPKISSNFDRPINRNVADKNDPPSGNTDNLTKKDQPLEPSKKGVTIKLTDPEITTKQGLPAVLYVKDEVVKDLASTCKYTLIGKFIYTMPRVELIRKNFILQTQLSGGVKIAHFNSRNVYIDLDNELDYNMVWTKQRMTIAGQVMRIQAWSPTFKPDEETPLVPIWISLPELPWHCYNKEFITSLLSPIGRVLYLDSASINKTKGSQARVKVQVDLTKDRPPHIWMGYIGEDITDGRWQKIEYDSIPDYCFYCKHQGHKESDCIIKQRDEENKKRKEMEKNKNRKDSVQINIADIQVSKTVETGRRELDHNQQRQPINESQQHMIQEEWHTQRRMNSQQVRLIQIELLFNSLKVKQEFTTVGGSLEEHPEQLHEHRPQNIANLNRQSQIHYYTAASNDHRESRNKQQRSAIQVSRTEQTGYQQETINRSGIDSMLPSLTPLNIVNDYVGVTAGGEVGSGQEDNRVNQSRLAKGKGKIGDQGPLSNVDKVPPNKININNPLQTSNKSSNPNFSNTGNDPTSHQRDNLDDYKEPDSEDEYDVDTQS
ncbi:hypothetical protein EJD97_017903 [Solanum chilense]|uniref:DUF4283 domain-containing protein n=1 Tax=Solanum chilense TaxID=4083 RepID=A0A6N2B5Y4_SOLCI|nr:hypothetical protein EJD97_017903 [Solanum chilense]